MKFIPLANLKNTTGIVTTCKEEKELIVANKNGVPVLVLMSREVYVTRFGEVTDNVYINMRCDVELVAEPILIRIFNNLAEVVRICEGQTGYIIPVLRNGVEEIYVMEYWTYQERKNYLKELYNMHFKSKN